MPKKPSTTREAMIEGAFELIRIKGYESLTVRNLANFIGCSTQPIMYQFPSLDTLKEAVYKKADKFHSEYILLDGDLIEIGLRYIRFAKEEPHLFRFLFQSNHFSGCSLLDLIKSKEAADILAAVSIKEGLSKKDAITFFEPLVAIVHGYASLIANNAMKYNPKAIRKTLIKIGEGLERIKQNDETI